MYKSCVLFLKLLLILAVFSCGDSKVKNLQKRVDNFRNILPEKTRLSFDAGDYGQVVQDIDSLLTSDSTFIIAYERVKDREAINVFTSSEVVEFYRVHLVGEIEKEKRKNGEPKLIDTLK